MQKAEAACRASGLASSPTTRDQRGRAGGRPGVRSARYAGEHARTRRTSTSCFREVPPDGDNTVTYVCAIAYAEPGGERRTFDGHL